MTAPAPVEPASDPRITVERYFGLVAEGVLAADDRVELLEGVIVAMSPQSPRHAGVLTLAAGAVRRAVGDRATVREEKPLLLGSRSAPEPDIAVVPGESAQYVTAHPTTALLMVEVADSSLIEDRLTKAALYAAAGIPEYWIVNLHDERIELFREPVPERGGYAVSGVATRGAVLALVAVAGVRIAVDELLSPVVA